MTQLSHDSALNPPMARPTATGKFALGLGLTNECNLACSFCYRDPARTDRLSLEQVKSVIESLPIRAVNLGTGENGMHPQFREILSYLRTLPVKFTITSNGHSAEVLTDDELRAFHDIEFSLDYSSEEKQDTQRGSGNWVLLHQQAQRCVRLGVPVTFIAVMMKSNYLRLASVARVVKRYDSPLRVNVYQAVRSDLYALSYEEYWQGFRALFAETDVIAIGEPLVRAMAGLTAQNRWMRGEHGADYSSSHGATLRVLARSRRPALAFVHAGLGSRGYFTFCRGAQRSRSLPLVRLSPSCYGGCAGRRRLQNALDQPDFYCPVVKGRVEKLEIRMAAARELPKMESACTTIVIARD